jgi:hypothetical protein
MKICGRLHVSASLPLGKEGSQGGFVGLRTGLDALAKRKMLLLPGIETQSLANHSDD